MKEESFPKIPDGFGQEGVLTPVETFVDAQEKANELYNSKMKIAENNPEVLSTVTGSVQGFSMNADYASKRLENIAA